MGNITNALIGYKDEVTYATRVRDGASPYGATQVIAFGKHYDAIPLPTEKPAIKSRTVATSYDFSELLYGKKVVDFDLKYMLLEGQSLQYAFGKCAVGGAVAGVYPHTITCVEPSDGATIASRTVHVETLGLASQKYFDICGCITGSINVGWDKDNSQGAIVTEKLIGQRVTDEEAGYTTAGAVDAEKAAVTYTNKPAFLSSGLTESYPFRLTEVKTGASNVIDDLNTLNIRHTNALMINYAQRSGLTDNYNVDQNHYLSSIFLKAGRTHLVTLNMLPTDNAFLFYDKLKQQNYDLDLTVKFERTSWNNKTHEIEWTFNASVTPVTDISGLMDTVANEDTKFTILLQPRTLVSLISKDENATYSLEP